MSDTPRLFVVLRDHLSPYQEGEGGPATLAILAGQAAVVVPEIELIHKQRQLEDAQVQLQEMAGLLNGLLQTHRSRFEYEGYRKLTNAELAQIEPVMGRYEASKTREMPEATRLEIELNEACDQLRKARQSATESERAHSRDSARYGYILSLATRLLEEPGAQLSGLDYDYEHPLHNLLLEQRTKYIRATDLISRLLTVHEHEPLFTPEDEMVAREFANEHFRIVCGLDGKPLPQALVDQQQDTINRLRVKIDDQSNEIRMLREYEGEWEIQLKAEEQEKNLARDKLLSIANRMGHQPFGPLAKEIDTFLDQAKARDKARENGMDGDPETTTLVIATKPLARCQSCQDMGVVTHLDERGAIASVWKCCDCDKGKYVVVGTIENGVPTHSTSHYQMPQNDKPRR